MDRYLIPKPFARCPFVVGKQFHVPADLNDEQREACAAQLTIEINKLEKEAERLAGHPDYPAEWTTE